MKKPSDWQAFSMLSALGSSPEIRFVSEIVNMLAVGTSSEKGGIPSKSFLEAIS